MSQQCPLQAEPRPACLTRCCTHNTATVDTPKTECSTRYTPGDLSPELFEGLAEHGFRSLRCHTAIGVWLPMKPLFPVLNCSSLRALAQIGIGALCRSRCSGEDVVESESKRLRPHRCRFLPLYEKPIVTKATRFGQCHTSPVYHKPVHHDEVRILI